MQFPWYKNLASYFADILIERSSSEFNPELKVFLSRGRLKLCTPSAVYSEAEIYYNFSEIFKSFKFQHLSFNKTLVLGLGLGSIPIMLEKIYKVKSTYDIIELDQKVIDLYNRYVQKRLKSKIDIIHQDALVFMETNTNSYDLICVDLFIDNMVPVIFEKNDFLTKLRESLSPNGILIYNRINVTNKDLKANNKFDETFVQIFPNRVIYPVGCNSMFTVK